MNDTALQRIKENKESKDSSLDLSDLGLTKIPSEIKKLSWLTSLDLSNNEIKTIEGLDSLTQLQDLDLKNNEIKTIEGLESLPQLQILTLSNNEIKTIEGLESLPQLQRLFLDNNEIKTIEGLESLPQLQILTLDGNEIKTIEGLESLPKLRILTLNNNEIKTIEGLESLPKLRILSLNNNEIKTIEGLESLPQLQFFDLSNNEIKTIEGLESLPQLQILDLKNNEIKTIEGLESLPQLQILTLSNNEIKTIEGLESLSQLQCLDLANTKIDDLRPLLVWLSSIDGNIYWERLSIEGSLSQNQDPTLLSIEIEIEIENEIEFFQALTSYFSAKRGLYLHDCSYLKIPSPEWVQQGKQFVVDYLATVIEQGPVEMNEAKVMVVGRPHAGKTSASVKLRDSDGVLPKTTETTRGIEVEDWEYQKDGVDYTAHLWDFGGQDVQYAIHQFFMTQRAVYLLVDCTRDPEGNSHLMGETGSEIISNYWLQTIKNLANSSPTFYLYNLYEPYAKNLSVFENLERQYGDFLYKYPFEVNLHQVSSSNESRILLIRNKLQEAIAELPNVGLVLPRKWAEIKEVLHEEAGKLAHISLTRYLEICDDHGVNDEASALFISQYFHEIGSLIHYSDDPSSPLYKLIILQRKWATSATYQVILDQQIRDQNGMFTTADLHRIWSDPQYKSMTSELLGLLQKFEICYELPNASPKQYLIPQCLPDRSPEGIDEHLSNPLSIQYRYEFLPYGIINRLTVRLHSNIFGEKVWKRGMVLQKAEGRILVEEVKNINSGFIKITFSGDQKDRWYLQQKVMEELDDLNQTMNLTSNTSVMVPCTCKACAERDSPYLHPYPKLIEKLRLRKMEEECGESPFATVKILDLIDHAFFTRPEAVEQSLNSSPDFRGAHIGKLVMGDNHDESQTVTAAQEAIVQVSESGGTNNTQQRVKEDGKKSLLEYFRLRQLIGWLALALAVGVIAYFIPPISAWAGLVFVGIFGYGAHRSLTSDGKYIRNARWVLLGGFGLTGILTGLPAFAGLLSGKIGSEESGFIKFAGSLRIDENPWITALILVLTFGLAGYLFYKDKESS